MHINGEGVEFSPGLHFKYLRRSAEEGYSVAQHLLGVAFQEGKLVKKNYMQALAWFRQAAKNGYPVSYYNAGIVLHEGGHGLKPNKMFALTQYMSAYKYGALFLQETIEPLMEELKAEGHRLPKVTFP